MSTGFQDRVDVEPLRRAFLTSGRSANSLARELGLVRGDATRMRRLLGIVPQGTRSHPRPNHLAKTIDRSLAEQIAELLDVAPNELDL